MPWRNLSERREGESTGEDFLERGARLLPRRPAHPQEHVERLLRNTQQQSTTAHRKQDHQITQLNYYCSSKVAKHWLLLLLLPC